MFKWIRTIFPDAGRSGQAMETGTSPVSRAAQSEAYRRQGNSYLADGDLERAEECYRRAITAAPGSADAHINLGFVLLEQKRTADAKYYLQQAVSINPEGADSHYLLGKISQEQNRPGEAIENFNRALKANPDFVEAHYGLGITFRTQGKLDEALRCFDKALSLRPESQESRFNKSLLLLLRGDFADGLELFESRLALCDEKHILAWTAFLSNHPEKPRWGGQSLNGKTLLVWTEQGAGDCIMAMRYLPKLAEKGVGGLLVLSDPLLTRLMQTLPIVSDITSRVDDLSLDSFDFHCPMMSLPLLFGTRLDTIPNAVPYLSVTAEMGKKWRERLAERKGLSAGLVWGGNEKYGRDFLRSLSLRQLGPLLETAGVTFVSLQKGTAADQLDEMGWPILNWMNECEDFLDTAALLVNLDLVISVDTSVVHLAGALGKPVWLLNRFESEWRWQLDREDSPWYPTMHIFRQSAPNDWDSVITRVARELAELAGSAATKKRH
jgi:tetratricopeptide (TPR) repeat protein